MARSLQVLVGGLLLTGLTSFFVAANQPPVARISAYRTAEGSSSVVFDGSGSSDPDGQVVRYQWLFGDGTTGSGSPVTHAYAAPSLYTVTLVVWDNASQSGLVTQVLDIASLPRQQVATPSLGLTPAATEGTAVVPPPLGNTVGYRAPEIALPDMMGGMTYLSTYLGRPVLIEFWLSTCPGCIASTPGLESYRVRYADRGLVVMLVVLDRAPSAAVSYLRQYGFRNFALAWESSGQKPTLAAYGVVVTPTTFLIDRAGVIQFAGHPSGLTDALLQSRL